MRLLLDTHILLWAAGDFELLPREARELIEDGDNEIFFSVASLWEIVIKNGLRRADFAVDPQELRQSLLTNDFVELPILAEHALAVGALSDLHKDPFDRLLVAQAMVEQLTLLTADARIAQYPGPVRAV